MEEENAQLRTELASLREELAKAHDVMTALLAAQEQPASSAPETAEAIPTASLDDRFAMPRGYPYGLPHFFAPNTAADTGSSLNVMPKSTLDQLSYQGAPLRRSTFLVKAFDGSRKSVLGEVDLPMTIGPETFLITFQVMDIDASYSCLLGRPWIHEAGAVTSTLHQKLKFVRNGKLVTVHGEEAYLVSQLSSFSCIEAGSAEGTAFQGLTVEGTEPKKDAQKAVQEGQAAGWGQLIQLLENKRKEGLGLSPTSGVSTGTFYSAGFANTITEGATGSGSRPMFVISGGTAKSWNVVDLPLIMHDSE